MEALSNRHSHELIGVAHAKRPLPRRHFGFALVRNGVEFGQTNTRHRSAGSARVSGIPFSFHRDRR